MKIIIVGPPQTGKTTIANILAEHSEGVTPGYKPTRGVRILELEKDASKSLRKGADRITIEFWDAAGQPSQEKFFPAISHNAQGLIFVYNPDNPNLDKEMDYYIKHFAQSINIPPNQCMCLANHFGVGQSPIKKTKPPQKLMNVQFADCSAENPSTVYVPFERFFKTLVDTLNEKQQSEEENIMNNY